MFQCSKYNKIPVCRNKFKAHIVSKSNTFYEMTDGRLKISFNKLDQHEKVLKNDRCHGNKRENQGAHLMAEGITNIWSRNILHNETSDIHDSNLF